MTPTAAIEVDVRPLAAADIPRLWEILRENPACNFDDSGPRTLDDFEMFIAERLGHEFIVAFHVAGELAGAMGFRQMNERLAQLRGVCFAQAAWGTGIPRHAIGEALAGLFAAGVEKIEARMFADNERAWKFFQKLGAVEEGLQRASAMRDGQLVDVRVFAIFREREAA